MSQWDPQFKPLLACNDPGEPPQKGGLLMAHYGKGIYIYLRLCILPSAARRRSRRRPFDGEPAERGTSMNFGIAIRER